LHEKKSEGIPGKIVGKWGIKSRGGCRWEKIRNKNNI